jgi:hypothetical protein
MAGIHENLNRDLPVSEERVAAKPHLTGPTLSYSSDQRVSIR